MSGTKICMLYYKNILDECFYRFFDIYNNRFRKTQNGKYAFVHTSNKKNIYNIFRTLIIEQIQKYTAEFDINNPRYYFIIGGCTPKENMLLDYTETKISEKLINLLENKPDLKYILTEKDIEIDIHEINRVVNDIFDDLFESKKKKLKYLGNNYSNVFMLRHKRLDCYAIFKIMKFIYGSANCVNIYVEQIKKRKPAILAINEILNTKITGKHKMNKSSEFIQAVDSIRKYTNECLKEIYG